MPSTVVYEAKFQTNNYGVTDTIIIRITQKPVFGGSVAIFSINDDRDRLPEGAWIIRTVDNDDNPFTPIKAKEAEFRFFSSNAFSLSSFAKGESDEWFVVAYIGSVATPNIFFRGYLVMDVTSEFLEPHPYVVSIKATDNLALLKNKELFDFNGLTPAGDNKIISYVAWALNQTGMQLPIFVNHNLTEENNPGVPMFESCFIDARTFEDKPTNKRSTRENCYSVLEKILKSTGSRIEQIGGAWWIENIYEKRDVASYVHEFTYDGTYVGVSAPTFYLDTIDERGAIDFVNDNAQVTIQSPFKSVTLNYNLENPGEIPDNITFSRGALISFNSGTLIGTYQFDDWTLYDNGTPNPATATAYIQRLFQDVNMTYEKEKFVVIKTNINSLFYLSTNNRIPVQAGDKFTISCDSKFDVDIGGSGFYRYGILQVVLHGDDGSTWKFHGGSSVDPNPRWHLGTFDEYVYREGDLSEDLREWRPTMGGDAPPIPVDGELEIRLSRSTQVGTETHFGNLQFAYIPLIKGDYSKYSTISNTVSQSGNYLRTLDDQIYISDSPKKIFKGALKIWNGTKYVLAGNFYDGQTFPSGVPSSEFLHPFSFQLSYFIWQQYRMFKRAIETDMIGLKCSSYALIPDLQKQYFSSIVHPHLNNKYFMLLHYEQDFDSQVWRAYLWECYDTVVGVVFTDTYEQKYITG